MKNGLLNWKAILDFKDTIHGGPLDSMETMRGDRVITYIELYDPEDPSMTVLSIGFEGHTVYQDHGVLKEDDVALKPESYRESVALARSRLVYRVEARSIVNTGEQKYRGQQITLEQVFTVRNGDEFKFKVGYRFDCETQRIERITEVPEKNWLGGSI